MLYHFLVIVIRFDALFTRLRKTLDFVSTDMVWRATL